MTVDDSSATALARQEESIAALERGELPLASQDRIAELRDSAAAWTTDLSVAELSAIRHAGFQPVGMVLGSSVFRIAAQWGYSSQYLGVDAQVRRYPCPHGWANDPKEHYTGYNWEHTNFEAGVAAARDAALARITEEARALDAHGVVGVRLIRRQLEGVGNTLEFTVIGTAIRREGGPSLSRPFMSHLDGTAFGKLLHGGYVPVSLVIGIGAIEIDPGCGMEWQSASWGNARIDQLGEGFDQARRLGISRLEDELEQCDADGAVGVEIDLTVHELHTREASLIEMVTTGTAVRRYAKDPLDEVPLPIMRLR